jgi:sugar/nucleoside kinase (ribokinase family)
VKRILVAGELNVDLVFRDCQAFPAPGREVLAEDAVVVPGSSSMICAMGLARLGNPVAFAGKVGVDGWGGFCVSALQGAGIDVAAVRRDASLRTGITASFSTSADRALVTFAGAIGALRASDIDCWPRPTTCMCPPTTCRAPCVRSSSRCSRGRARWA